MIRRLIAALIGRPALHIATWATRDPRWDWCRQTPGLIDRSATDWNALNKKPTKETR